jgi:UrcA family protein
MFKPATAAAAVVLAAALVVPTVSQAEDTRSMSVSYADLDLGEDQGQARLQGRIAFAARVLCDLGERSKVLELAYATKTCRAASIAGAQPAYDAAVSAARRGTVTVGEAAALIISAQ